MTAWTDDRIKELKRRWPRGETAEAIARALGQGLTRNAVLSKARRLGLTEDQTARRTVPASPPISPAPSCGTRSILTVRRSECRWPYGDPGERTFRMCGRPVERGAFCGAHAARAYSRKPMTADSLLHLADLSA